MQIPAEMKSIDLWLVVLLLGTSAASSAQMVTAVNLFGVPSAASGPAITVGPDGALWFTEESANQIGRITTAGVVTEFAVPTANSGPEGITAGPDGALWFTELNGNQIGRITTAGVVTEFAVPTANSGPAGITAGPDGALWFTESRSANYEGAIGRITTAGVVSNEYPITAAFDNGTQPSGITAGSDGALWFTTNGNESSQIGRITTSGVMTDNAWGAAVGLPGNGIFYYITAGPDGALWFTENIANRIGRLTTAGALTEYQLPYLLDGAPINWEPEGIAVGPDGALWFTQTVGNQIGRITTAGVITEYDAFNGEGITMGPDGALWFTVRGGSIGRAIVSEQPLPAINAGGVLNSASYTTQGVALGSIVSIFGTNLAASTAVASSIPLPTMLSDVASVTFNNIPAGLYFVSQNQINAQLPFDVLPSGQNSGTVNIVVTRNGGSSAPQSATVVPASPGIFTTTANGLGQAFAYDNTTAALAAPAGASIGSFATAPISISSGHALIIACTGLGSVNPSIGDYVAASDGILRYTALTPTVLIGGVAAQPVYSVLSPQFVSEYQIGVIPAANTPTGDAVSLQIEIGGVTTTNQVTIAVAP